MNKRPIPPQKKLASHAGFTLMELMISIGIIAVLATVAIAMINPKKQLGDAQNAKRRVYATEQQNAAIQYEIDKGAFPAQNIPTGNAVAAPICRQGTQSAGCLNIDTLVPGNIISIPVDVSETDTTITGYRIYMDQGSRITVCADFLPPSFDQHCSGAKVPTPGTPDMTTATDNGTYNDDNVTTITQPAFTISCMDGELVSLFSGSTVLGTNSCSGGTTTITASTLSVGNSAITATQSDTIAGTSSVSGILYAKIVSNATVTACVIPTGYALSSPPALAGTTLYFPTATNTLEKISTVTDTLLGSITVGTSASSPVSPTLIGTKLYVLNYGDSSLSAVDTTTNTVTSTTALGSNYWAILGSIGTKLYLTSMVAHSGNTVSVFDTASNTITATITVGTAPTFAVVSGTKLYVINNFNGGTGTVSVVDTTTNTVTATVTVGTRPLGATLVGTKLYVYYDGTSISVVDTTTNTVTKTIVASGSPANYPSAGTVVGTNLYVVNRGTTTANIQEIDTTTDTTVATLSVNGSLGSAPLLIGTKLYFGSFSSGNFFILDTTTNAIKKTIAMGTAVNGAPILIGHKIYIFAGQISVMDSNTDEWMGCGG
jgi:prepilin-type N-terminal cleavage/methylation domain-containing protein